jgi:hypothetical protein
VHKKKKNMPPGGVAAARYRMSYSTLPLSEPTFVTMVARYSQPRYAVKRVTRYCTPFREQHTSA